MFDSKNTPAFSRFQLIALFTASPFPAASAPAALQPRCGRPNRILLLYLMMRQV